MILVIKLLLTQGIDFLEFIWVIDVPLLFLASRSGRLIAYWCGIACQVVVQGFVHALLVHPLVAATSAVEAEE